MSLKPGVINYVFGDYSEFVIPSLSKGKIEGMSNTIRKSKINTKI